ncbi:MAG: helix-turn-helix domain-containing protein, partial [Phycisphaeraceae bacterium]
MADLAQTLKQEIRRLARSEIRTETKKLRDDSARYRRDIASLKRQVAQLTRDLAFLRQQEQKRVAQPPAADSADRVRFSPKWLRSHRSKLGLSQQDYGKLVGVSGLTIYNWENGKTSPRQQQLAAWGQVRSLGMREASKR